MKRRIVGALSLVVMIASCGGDEPEPAPEQQADTTPAAAPQPTPAQRAAAARADSTRRAQAAANAAATAASTDLASAPRLRTVQVAAFVNAASARALIDRLEKDGVPAWTSTTTLGGEQFTRVRVGVATTGDEVRTLAEKVRAQYHWPVWITLVEDRSAVSATTLVASRSYAGGR